MLMIVAGDEEFVLDSIVVVKKFVVVKAFAEFSPEFERSSPPSLTSGRYVTSKHHSHRIERIEER